MSARFLLVPLIGLALAAGVVAQDSGKAELKRLQGTWHIISMEIDGKRIPATELKKMTVVFAGDNYLVKQDDKEVEKGSQQLDPSKSPKTVDVQILEGPDKGKQQRGIYELTGDTLKMCFGAAGQERPTDFSSKPGSKQELGVFQRQK